ncbi:hypothetical protein EVJ27_11095 [Exiguobacterium sp. SH3S2]|uniref:hypothetical protein n=2 Tax=Bacillales Family XII. Incertae Sedis TaxID=539742 RepID=UPI0003531D84|nr:MULTISPECIES: hypothetical protein [unclassified Exiguobacterium]EPE62491.1 hypothetical protein L479_01088 [Exiguobacterium sp. S17]TCI36551.1 hypothetical protein EVJ29_08715 [Exiguobacterium sp. SH4S7]TCI43185.1 hypothetical protein EVJ28_11115 [Exiguobacterium sp. SH3S3]TCI70329.1 hypothetical protein EVJ22_08340 [Exiguobacterium sp. SH0S7]TCI75285.1 hypothetical protein EVJ23_06110 [Exiguobacterium sp. SH1S1]
METVILVIGIIGVISLMFFMSNQWMGYSKGNIVMTLDDHHTDLNQYVPAILTKLYEDGKSAHYLGDRKFEVDGKRYVLVERTVPIGRVPTQQTVLMPDKTK